MSRRSSSSMECQIGRQIRGRKEATGRYKLREEVICEGEVRGWRGSWGWMRRWADRRKLCQTLKRSVARRGKLTPAEAYEAAFLLKANEDFLIYPSLRLAPYVIIHTIRSVWFRTLPHNFCFLWFFFFVFKHFPLKLLHVWTGHKCEWKQCVLPERRWARILTICQNDRCCWMLLNMIPLKVMAVGVWVEVTRRAHMGPSFPFPHHPQGTPNFWIRLVAALAESGTTLKFLSVH